MTTTKSKDSSDDKTIRVQPRASEKWNWRIPREVKTEPFFTGKFLLEVYPEHLEIPRNGSVVIKIQNPTDNYQEVMVERCSYADYWPVGGRLLKLQFVMDPRSSKDVQFEHADNVIGKWHNRKLIISHGVISDKKEADKRRKEIAKGKPKKTKYEVIEDSDGMDYCSAIRGKYEFEQKIDREKGAYHLIVGIKPEPPVTKDALKKDPTPVGKERKEPDDPFYELMQKDWLIEDKGSGKSKFPCCCC